MKMRRKSLVTILGIVTLLMLLVGCQAIEDTTEAEGEATDATTENDEAEVHITDALAFKLEHEELNGVPHPDNSELLFKEMYIPEDNPFRYAEFDEIIDLLEDGTGIVYFGFPTCPWCRNLVPVLTNAAIDFGVDEILYRNVLYDRNILELEDGEVVEVRAGHPGYYQVLDILGDFAPEYRELEDASIRRIFVPAVVFVQDGEMISYYESLPSFQDRVSGEELGGWLSMNEDEIEELTQIFMSYFEELFGE